jgi:putative heme-binding domain-containing protein
VEAVLLLGQTSFADSSSTLLSLLNLQQPQAIQLAAVSTLARFNDPQVGTELTKRWDSMTPRLRSEAVTVLLARKDRALALLQAIESGGIRVSALDTTQAKFLRNHRDLEVKKMATRILAAKPAGTRQQVVESFISALDLKGDVAHGRKIYEERCISCHRLGGEGFALGPDLVTVKNTGKEKILVNILDPNREVRPDYISYLVETKDDESTIGLIVNETATAVTLRQAYGKESVINRSDIKKMQSQGQSLMPEGLEAGMQQQDLADLIGYIETAEAGAANTTKAK